MFAVYADICHIYLKIPRPTSRLQQAGDYDLSARGPALMPTSGQRFLQASKYRYCPIGRPAAGSWPIRRGRSSVRPLCGFSLTASRARR